MDVIFLVGGFMNDNIIRFYILANKLKNALRTGWLEIGIEKERTESVAEHIYGCLILAIGIASEYELDVDMFKVLKMLTLHELEEILMPDYTLRSNITKEEKIQKGRICVHKVVSGLCSDKEIEDLLDEFNAHETNESKFCYLIDKIECDFQAKLYDLEGVMSYEKTREDLSFYGNRAEYIDAHSKCASDLWIEYDRPKYDDDIIFRYLISDIKKINNKQYKKIMNTKMEE